MHTERLSLARGLTPVTWLASIASMAVAIVSITGCSRAEEARFPSGTTDPPRSVARSDAPIPAFDAPTQEELSLRGEEQGASKPRLSRTLRLGADESVYARPTAAAAPGSGGVTVIVNNNISQTQQTVVSTGGGYGRGHSRQDGRRVGRQCHGLQGIGQTHGKASRQGAQNRRQQPH